MTAIWLFIQEIPARIWAIIVATVLAFVLLWSWGHSRYKEGYDAGIAICAKRDLAAQTEALDRAAKQATEAPVVAKEAREAVKPKVEERIRIIREQIPANSCSDDYPDGVQQVIREAAAAAN
jgi:hypothetical protein